MNFMVNNSAFFAFFEHSSQSSEIPYNALICALYFCTLTLRLSFYDGVNMPLISVQFSASRCTFLTRSSPLNLLAVASWFIESSISFLISSLLQISSYELPTLHSSCPLIQVSMTSKSGTITAMRKDWRESPCTWI